MNEDEDDGGPYHPIIEPNHPTPIILTGASLRDWFAGQIVRAVIDQTSINEMTSYTFKVVAENSYLLADAMLAARQPQKEV